MTVHALETAVRHFNIGRGVTKTSLHLFRHTFAKNYIMAGGGMAKALDSKILEKTSIIPSTGAQNVKHLCSILMGWGFKFLAVFDYDKEGIRCAKDLNKELNLEYSDSFILLKDVSSDVFYNNGAIDRSDYIVIETMIDDTDRTEYGITHDGTQQQKKITAVRFSSAVQNGNDLSDATKHSFSTLFNRILSHT